MKIKVIENGYGAMQDEHWLKEFKKFTKDYTLNEIENSLWRTNQNLIKLIENKHKEISWLKEKIEATKDKNELKKYENKFNKLVDQNGWGDKSWLYFHIKEIDTSRKWFFDEYDGAVSVSYLKEVNNDLNLFEVEYN